MCDKALTKTNVMIFNKTGKIFKQFKFYFGNSQIEVTNEYCYLGIVFVPCGSFSVAIKRLYDKSIKAFFQLKKFDSRSNITLYNEIVCCFGFTYNNGWVRGLGSNNVW